MSPVCLLLSAFFSSSETALTSITREKALQLLEENKKYQKYLDLIIDKTPYNSFKHGLADLLCNRLGQLSNKGCHACLWLDGYQPYSIPDSKIPLIFAAGNCLGVA